VRWNERGRRRWTSGVCKSRLDAAPTPVLSAPKPALQVGSIHDAEHQDHMVSVDDVVHHAIVADAQPVEGVVSPADRFDGLAGDASGPGDVSREPLKGSTDTIAISATELPELPHRRLREPDLVGSQSISSRLTVRRFA